MCPVPITISYSLVSCPPQGLGLCCCLQALLSSSCMPVTCDCTGFKGAEEMATDDTIAQHTKLCISSQSQRFSRQALFLALGVY